MSKALDNHKEFLIIVDNRNLHYFDAFAKDTKVDIDNTIENCVFLVILMIL